MKKVRLVLTCLTLAIALTGVIVVKANEKKRTTFTAAYYDPTGGGTRQTLTSSQGFVFDNVNITRAATIVQNGSSTPLPLYDAATGTNPVSFNP